MKSVAHCHLCTLKTNLFTKKYYRFFMNTFLSKGFYQAQYSKCLWAMGLWSRDEGEK